MAGGIVTLLTDFGLSDHYVGVLKGVILRFNPSAQIVDLTHQVEPFDVLGASFTLAAAHSYFPPGTVHAVVVDPGVGGDRRPILAEAGGWLFLAPDNGVLEWIYRRRPARVRALQPDRFALQPISNTFQGRDIFAPAAGLLSGGESPERLGDPIEDFARLDLPCPRQVAPGRWQGEVLKVDRFGNLITNFTAAELPARFWLTVGQARVEKLHAAYSSAPPGAIFAIAGSSGFIEISVKEASAAAAAGAGPGAPVAVQFLGDG